MTAKCTLCHRDRPTCGCDTRPCPLLVDDAPDGDGGEASLHPRTSDLVDRFAAALKDKLSAAETKYGYNDGWAHPGWMDACRAQLMEHIAKGDPRDVAAYCAFLWHHGESTSGDEGKAQKLWLWKNFVDGKPEYWAFDNPYPIHHDNDDPQTLGEPCGYAIFKPSRHGRKDVSEEQVLRAIDRAAKSAPKGKTEGDGERMLAKYQPCGCVVCMCEDEEQCHGCGAKSCGTHPVGQLPNPVYANTEQQENGNG